MTIWIFTPDGDAVNLGTKTHLIINYPMGSYIHNTSSSYWGRIVKNTWVKHHKMIAMFKPDQIPDEIRALALLVK